MGLSNEYTPIIVLDMDSINLPSTNLIVVAANGNTMLLIRLPIFTQHKFFFLYLPLYTSYTKTHCLRSKINTKLPYNRMDAHEQNSTTNFLTFSFVIREYTVHVVRS